MPVTFIHTFKHALQSPDAKQNKGQSTFKYSLPVSTLGHIVAMESAKPSGKITEFIPEIN